MDRANHQQHGESYQVYHWLADSGYIDFPRFPHDMRARLDDIGKAIHASYTGRHGDMHIIHTLAPDIRESGTDYERRKYGVRVAAGADHPEAVDCESLIQHLIDAYKNSLLAFGGANKVFWRLRSIIW